MTWLLYLTLVLFNDISRELNSTIPGVYSLKIHPDLVAFSRRHLKQQEITEIRILKSVKCSVFISKFYLNHPWQWDCAALIVLGEPWHAKNNKKDGTLQNQNLRSFKKCLSTFYYWNMHLVWLWMYLTII